MKQLINSFFKWYNKHLLLNTAIAAVLFGIQLVHLYWLSADVVAMRLIGQSFFPLEGFWQFLITVVDYTEIPALITTSLLYINDLRAGKNPLKNIAFLIFLNSQWLHIFWITDEYVIEHFLNHSETSVLPLWLAWIAIAIDYLELPVIFDTFKKLFDGLKSKDLKSINKALKED